MHFDFLTPSSSYLTQPVDLTYFRRLQMKWKDVPDQWKQSDTGKTIGVIPKDQFPRLLRTASEEIDPNMKSNLKAGLKKAGLMPTDKNQIISRLRNQDNFKTNANLSMIRDAFPQRLQEMRGEFVTPRTT